MTSNITVKKAKTVIFLRILFNPSVGLVTQLMFTSDELIESPISIMLEKFTNWYFSAWSLHHMIFQSTLFAVT